MTRSTSSEDRRKIKNKICRIISHESSPLAPADCRSEDICVLAAIIAELEFGNIEGMYFLLTLWELPTMPRLKMDQNPSIVRVWIAPTTYCFAPFLSVNLNGALG